LASLLVLASVAATIALGIGKCGSPERIRQRKAREDEATLLRTLVAFRRENGMCPSSAAILPPGARRKDPWGRDYAYACEQAVTTVTTLGADGKPGGIGEDADISTSSTSDAKVRTE
jgi:hypothetical protein